MLIDQHTNTDARHVETIQEILNGQFHRWFDVALAARLQLDHALRHRLHHVGVSIADFDQICAESGIVNGICECVRSSVFLLLVFG